MDILLNCPFCGSNHITIYETDTFVAKCDNCNVSSDMFSTLAETIIFWNNRAS